MKLPFDDATIRRFSRQILLSEIGGAGQQRLLDARVWVRGPVAAEYLRRAGVGEVEELPDETRTAVDRWVSGSMAALGELKRILELGR